MKSLNSLPGRNLGTFAALILMDSPVLGFLPFLAALLVTLKAPKPTRLTLSPFFTASITLLVKAFTAFSADALLREALAAIFSTISALVIFHLLKKRYS